MKSTASLNSSVNLNEKINHHRKKCNHCHGSAVTRSRTRFGESSIIRFTGYRPYRCIECYRRSWRKYSNLQIIIISCVALIFTSTIIYGTFFKGKLTSNGFKENVTVATPSSLVSKVIITPETIETDKQKIIANDAVRQAQTFKETPKAPTTKLIASDIKTSETIDVDTQDEVVKQAQTIKEARSTPIITLASDNKKTDSNDTNSDRKNKRQIIVNNIRRWQKSWQNGEISDYLKLYSKDFEPQKKQSLSAWRAARTNSLAKSVGRRIILSEFDLNLSKDTNSAELMFTQEYRSITFSDKVRKLLILQREDNDYKIIKEIILDVL